MLHPSIEGIDACDVEDGSCSVQVSVTHQITAVRAQSKGMALLMDSLWSRTKVV